MRSVLPTGVLNDFNGFVQVHRLPRMDPDDPLSTLPPITEGPAKNELPEGTYNVSIQGNVFKFHHVELAPPGGVIGCNYSR